jgi:hypothetical protein
VRRAGAIALLGLAACAGDPRYLPGPANLEVGGGPGDPGVASASLSLPFDEATLTGAAYARERARLLAAINARLDPQLTDEQLPLVRLDQLAISVEWTIRNLADQDGHARILLGGGNPLYRYLPDAFVLDAEEDETPPPLLGNIPIPVPARGDVAGVFREDQLREAAIDLELITRGGLNPFAAILALHQDITSTADVPFIPYPPDQDPPPAPPPPLPIEAFGHLVQLDLTFVADRHMVLEYVVRVRDPDGLLHRELLAAPAGEVLIFMPAPYSP